MDDYKKLKQKREDYKALAAAITLSEYCRRSHHCDGCVFEMDIKEALPCALLRSGIPGGNWELYALRELKEMGSLQPARRRKQNEN